MKLGQDVSLLMTEKEKYHRDTLMGSENVKKIFEYFETLGFQQVQSKEAKVRKLYNLAYGKIDVEDYFNTEVPDELSFYEKETELEDLDIVFYPIIPNIVNAIVEEYNKKYMEYYASAINLENTNSITESMDAELQHILVSRMENMFLSENPQVSEEQHKAFMESEAVIDKYSKNYRTQIEQWANHTMANEDLKYDMKGIASGILRQIVVTEIPAVHVHIVDNYEYYPESIREKDLFYLKSPLSEDLSDSSMVGWFNYSNLSTIISRWAGVLDKTQITKLESWINKYYQSGFVVNGQHDAITGNRTADYESTQNHLQFQSMDKNSPRAVSDLTNRDLLRETTIYFLLPRLYYKLYYKGNGEEFSMIVDETFKVTLPPKYEKGKTKTHHTLIEGERIESFYGNEVWKGVKLDVNLHAPNYRSSSSQSTESIWVQLKKHDIQYSDPLHRYGVRIPVHGGPSTNLYNQSFSLVEKGAPWQVMYNWIWNRNQQLLSTEIGKFLVLNQGVIPNESMGESWEKDDLMKWAITGRDVGIAPADTSLSNMGQSAMQIHGGVGQVVDLNKTQDILEKVNLARAVKAECYQVAGLTEQYLYGDVSPQQTASSLAQGFQRSHTQIQHIYTRLDKVLQKLRNTMLETAQFIESQNPTSQVSYLTADSTRVIFEMNTDEFLLHKLNVYIKSNVADADVLEKIKNYAAQTNTLGADSLEMATLQASKNIPELFNKLRELKAKKDKEQEKARAHDMNKQKEMIAHQKETVEKELEAIKLREERNHEKDILVAQIRSIGYADGTADEVSKEILELQNANLKQKEFYEKLNYRRSLVDLQREKNNSTSENKALENKLRSAETTKKLEQKDRELDIREKDIAARNRRTKAID